MKINSGSGMVVYWVWLRVITEWAFKTILTWIQTGMKVDPCCFRTCFMYSFSMVDQISLSLAIRKFNECSRRSSMEKDPLFNDGPHHSFCHSYLPFLSFPENSEQKSLFLWNPEQRAAAATRTPVFENFKRSLCAFHFHTWTHQQ